MMRICLLTLLVSLTLGYSYAHAQTGPASIDIGAFTQQFQQLQNAALKPALDLSISPENPRAGEPVYFNVTGSAGVERATITWSVNGVRQASGVGLTKFNTVAPSEGKSVTVSVTATWLDGRSNSASKTIRLASVSLMWQALSYTPPFYRGKALAAYQSPVMFVAVPTFINSAGATIPASELMYQWKQNGEILYQASGHGKNTLTLEGSILLKPFDVEVVVSTVNNSITASESIYLEPIEPQVLLYRSTPLTGVQYEEAIPSQIQLSSNEVTFRAVPYYFLTGNAASNIPYNWSVNNQSVSNTSLDPRELTLRQEADGGGISNVRVQVQNNNTLLQSGERSVTIQLQDRLRNSGF